jgi:hypothetical protein
MYSEGGQAIRPLAANQNSPHPAAPECERGQATRLPHKPKRRLKGGGRQDCLPHSLKAFFASCDELFA